MRDNPVLIGHIREFPLRKGLEQVQLNTSAIARRLYRYAFEQPVRAGIKAVWAILNADQGALAGPHHGAKYVHVIGRRWKRIQPRLADDLTVARVMQGEQRFIVLVAERQLISHWHGKRHPNTDVTRCSANCRGIIEEPIGPYR